MVLFTTAVSQKTSFMRMVSLFGELCIPTIWITLKLFGIGGEVDLKENGLQFKAVEVCHEGVSFHTLETHTAGISELINNCGKI